MIASKLFLAANALELTTYALSLAYCSCLWKRINFSLKALSVFFNLWKLSVDRSISESISSIYAVCFWICLLRFSTSFWMVAFLFIKSLYILLSKASNLSFNLLHSTLYLRRSPLISWSLFSILSTAFFAYNFLVSNWTRFCLYFFSYYWANCNSFFKIWIFCSVTTIFDDAFFASSSNCDCLILLEVFSFSRSSC